MFFIDRLDLDRRFRILRRTFTARGISEELRGWSFEEPPVQPPGEAHLLSVSELAGRYCSSMRDIYLRRVLKVRLPPSVKLVRGLAFHAICHRLLFEVKKLVFEEFKGVAGFRVVEKLLPCADAAVEEINKIRPGKMCPLFRSQCTARCVCWVKARVYKWSRKGVSVYKAIGWACGNAMFTYPEDS